MYVAWTVCCVQAAVCDTRALSFGQFFMRSGLGTDVLGQIWRMADATRDGKLDAHEFAVAMHLIKLAREGRRLPATLPPELAAKPVLRRTLSPMSGAAMGGEYDHYFAQCDTDRDGWVTGQDVMPMFSQSGLPSATLASIWARVDPAGVGRLDRSQFAEAMALIKEARTGTPVVLSPRPPASPVPEARSANLMSLDSAGDEPGPNAGALQARKTELADQAATKQAEATAMEGKVQASRQEIETLEREVAELEVAVAEAERRCAVHEKQLSQLTSRASGLAAQHAAATKALAEAQAQADEAGERQTQAEQSVAQAKQAFLQMNQALAQGKHVWHAHTIPKALCCS